MSTFGFGYNTLWLPELKYAELTYGTFHVKTLKDFQIFHHGSESLNQIFSTDSPFKLK
jgi:hypothetical protein